MAAPLRVLLVEDSEDDALLLERQLRRGGLDAITRRVDSAAELRAALIQQPWDVIITDHNLPGFDSHAALEVVRASG